MYVALAITHFVTIELVDDLPTLISFTMHPNILVVALAYQGLSATTTASLLHG